MGGTAALAFQIKTLACITPTGPSKCKTFIAVRFSVLLDLSFATKPPGAAIGPSEIRRVYLESLCTYWPECDLTTAVVHAVPYMKVKRPLIAFRGRELPIAAYRLLPSLLVRHGPMRQAPPSKPNLTLN